MCILFEIGDLHLNSYSGTIVISNRKRNYIMAHMVETMAYAGETPWHGLGVSVSNELTPAQMMQKAGVNWEVHEVESFVEFNGDRIPTGQKSLIRGSDSKLLTNVGADWKPVQNATAFDFFSEFVLSGDMGNAHCRFTSRRSIRLGVS
jgi:hypothetical protein